MELSTRKIKKFLIFSQKKFFLYFGKCNFLKKLLSSSKNKKEKHSEKISYLSGNGTFSFQA